MEDGTGKATSFRLKPTLFGKLILAACLFLITAFLLLTGVLHPKPSPNIYQSLTQDVGRLGELDHVLHPESHIHRESTTIYHEWKVTKASRRPDGVLKDVYLINGLFPGPVLEARSGDTLVINVANHLNQEEGVSIHWHGLYMRGQNQYDGAVGFTQNPILPGSNFTYVVTIAEDQWGTFWYHAHEQVQRADGLFGAFIVHQPAEDGKGMRSGDEFDGETEDRLLLVGDWYHRPANDVLKWYLRAASFGNEPVPDSLLVNGQGAYNCSMAVPARPVDCEQRQDQAVPRLSLASGKRYRLRVINHGSLAGFSIGTNAARMRVIAVEGGHQVSSDGEGSSVGILYPGQRVDIMVTPEPNIPYTGALYWEISLDRENFKYPNPALGDQGVQRFPVDLPMATKTSISTPMSTADVSEHISLDSLTASIPRKLPAKADMTLVLYIATQKLSHLHNIPHGFMNQTTWKPQRKPPNPLINLSRDQWDDNQFVPHINFSTFAGMNGPWVDLVVNNLDDGGHPFHLHGHDVYVLSSHSANRGWGSYNPFDSPEDPPGPAHNFLNPVKRDTFFVPRRGYTVVRFRADNKGIWMFHCHLLWHQASGMAMGIEIS